MWRLTVTSTFPFAQASLRRGFFLYKNKSYITGENVSNWNSFCGLCGIVYNTIFRKNFSTMKKLLWAIVHTHCVAKNIETPVFTGVSMLLKRIFISAKAVFLPRKRYVFAYPARFINVKNSFFERVQWHIIHDCTRCTSILRFSEAVSRSGGTWSGNCLFSRYHPIENHPQPFVSDRGHFSYHR